MFDVEFTPDAQKNLKRFKRRNLLMYKRIMKSIRWLSKKPFYKGLRTHKVTTNKYGKRYSSKVSADIRLIWDFVDDNTIILLFTIGGHSGNKKVYK